MQLKEIEGKQEKKKQEVSWYISACCWELTLKIPVAGANPDCNPTAGHRRRLSATSQTLANRQLILLFLSSQRVALYSQWPLRTSPNHLLILSSTSCCLSPAWRRSTRSCISFCKTCSWQFTLRERALKNMFEGEPFFRRNRGTILNSYQVVLPQFCQVVKFLEITDSQYDDILFCSSWTRNFLLRCIRCLEF